MRKIFAITALSLATCLQVNVNAQERKRVPLADPDEAAQITDVVIAFKMHIDVGYTEWAEGVLQKYAGPMLEQTLSYFDQTAKLPKNEQFVWTIPAWPLHYMLENAAPELKVRLERAVQDGRIVAHALPFTSQTEANDLENLVRGMDFASKINRTYGLAPARDAKLTDVPSHSWILPTLLKHAGVDILFVGCNIGSISPNVPFLFWWQGVDGSKLMTFNWPDYYGTGVLPPKGWKYKTWLAMIHKDENTGSPSPREVELILKEVREKLPNAKVHFGRISDFYDLVMAEKPELPIVVGDMPDAWIQGYMSAPKQVKLSKLMQREIYSVEALNTLTANWEAPQATYGSIGPIIDKAVENITLFGEHTFGIAMSHGDQQTWKYGDDFRTNNALGYYDYAEASWHEKTNRIESAERLVSPVMRAQLKLLASQVQTQGKRILVFNPLPWTRNGRVDVFTGVWMKDFTVYAIQDLETGDTIKVYNDENLVSFDAHGLPAMGYKTFRVITDPVYLPEDNVSVDSKNNIVESQYFKIKINPETGALSSVYDKKSGRELVDQKNGGEIGKYIYELFGQEDVDRYGNAYIKPGLQRWGSPELGRPSVPEQQGQEYVGRCEKIIYKNVGNAIMASVFGVVNDPGQQRYVVNYVIYADQPYLKINWGVDGKRPTATPEAGWLSMRFAVDVPRYRLYRTGGIVDPQKDFIENTNQDYYFLNSSMCMFDAKGRGVAVNCPESPAVSIQERGGYRFSGTKQISEPLLFVNLFNTQWGTNFTGWIEGSFSASCYIWSFDKYDSESSLITPSEQTREPLYAAFADGRGGKLPATQQGVSLSERGVLVTAYGENKNGEGTLLRLWEQAGKSGRCVVTLPEAAPFTTAHACNLRGEISDAKGIRLKNHSFTVEIGANQPSTFILK